MSPKRRLNMFRHVMAVVLSGVLCASPAAAQNAVSDWSLKAQNAVTAGRPPGSSAYLLALVHAAMYDATVAIEGRYSPFRVEVEVPLAAMPEAAVAAAAYHVLRVRLPALGSTLAAEYAAYLATLGDGPAKMDGIAVGAAVAARWLDLRANDRFDNDVTYVPPPPGPGVWEPTAPTPPVDIKMAQVLPYVLPTADWFRPRGPRPLTSRVYARAFAEVYDLGRIDSPIRSPEQLTVARFWSEHAAIQWNRNLRQLAAAASLDLVDTARLLAMVHVASADAVVGCWDAKYHFLFWRPVHAIQRAETDDNRWTVPDPAWTALLNVNHPEYPSGHGCYTTAVTETLALAFGTDEAEFTLDSAVTGTSRLYSSFSEVAREVGDARVFAGLHFRFSIADGAGIGRRVARLVGRHHFRPARPAR
jgi:hypothetical protein